MPRGKKKKNEECSQLNSKRVTGLQTDEAVFSLVNTAGTEDKGTNPA